MIRDLGKSFTVLRCDCCGKEAPELTYTVRLQFALDDIRHYGSDCAEKALAASKPWAPAFAPRTVTVAGKTYRVSGRSWDDALQVEGHGINTSFTRDERVALRVQVADVIARRRQASREARECLQAAMRGAPAVADGTAADRMR